MYDYYDEKTKKLPLGIADFALICRQGYYYVDKTMYIPRLEMASNYLFLVRPRRFGKSLLLSMLEAYYDVNMADSFDQFFGQLWIGSHPTPLHNRYAVLHLDFSQVAGDITELKEHFNQYCSIIVDTFAQRYEKLFYPGFAGEVKNEWGASGKLSYVGAKAREHGVPLYLIVDEYDNFTNTVLNQHGEDVYRGLTHGERLRVGEHSSGMGFYRDVFKIFKGNFERVLMLGVSPVTMDDLTSGYNIATNITARSAFNQMLGFSEEEVRQMFSYYQDAGWLQGTPTPQSATAPLGQGGIEAMISEMKPWYDNYCFAEESLETESRVFNSEMVLYYLSTQVAEGHSPKSMLSPNARTDYQKMKRLIQLDQLEPQRKSIIYQIAEEGYIYAQLVPYFPASAMVKFDNFVSLLYYYGMLTITGTRGNKLRLGIPNNNVRKQYYGYLLEEYDRIRYADHQRLDDAFDSLALDCLIEGERNLQGFFTAYLTMSTYYLTAPELELNHGYCDFFLMPDVQRYPMVQHAYVVELKYLKQEATEAEADRQWQEAHEQIKRYATDDKVRLLCSGRRLHLLVAQFRGHKLERTEEVSL